MLIAVCQCVPHRRPGCDILAGTGPAASPRGPGLYGRQKSESLPRSGTTPGDYAVTTSLEGMRWTAVAGRLLVARPGRPCVPLAPPGPLFVGDARTGWPGQVDDLCIAEPGLSAPAGEVA